MRHVTTVLEKILCDLHRRTDDHGRAQVEQILRNLGTLPDCSQNQQHADESAAVEKFDLEPTPQPCRIQKKHHIGGALQNKHN